MLMGPRKSKHRKAFKGKIKGRSLAGSNIDFGTYGLKSLEPGRMSSKQIEAARKCISRAMKREGKFWNRMFPHLPVSGKPSDARMGGGKGGIDRHVAKVYPGSMLFEISGVSVDVAKHAFSLASEKLPFSVKFVTKEEYINVEYK